MAAPVIQVIERANYKNHHLVTLPDEPLPLLPPSSIRVRTELFTLSTNNFSYARLGHLFGWWDFHPIPPNTPAPFNDSSKYGRLSCWGIGVVTKSTSPLAPMGTKMYGYMPLGTLEVDKQITDAGVKNQIIETTEHRRNLLQGFYNRYMIIPPDSSETDLAWDSAMKVLFETSFLINQYAFSWDPEVHAPIFPTGTGKGEWSVEDTDLKDAVVLVFAASSKTAATLAQQVRTRRPKEYGPKSLIGIGSEGSRVMSRGFGWYDEVLLYSDDPMASLKEKFGVDANTKVVIIDFGSRVNAAFGWAAKLKAHSGSLKFITVGSSPDGGMGRPGASDLAELEGALPILGNAIALRHGAIENMGAEKYFEEMEDSWKTFKANGGMPGLEFSVKTGLDAFKQDWDGLAAGTVSPLKALLYRI